ncbi:MAG: adenylyltransferase/cytidyltransferase family protein [Patescibacteria group bacterium]|nr:adenylyltransferase/cytidyltransferase family protein [Patescibacteria group bacterium]MDD5294860.1 adenylyltransferase/cytidyltransferase family protein [Patescibacteria group bacterium]MDD5555038.1 adenylyltransferase/cytidyltransferase family protein [Patescibacteria group bacterium]
MGKVMCFGTFDNLHPGHLSYLSQARGYGDYLIVVVARDANVDKLKGKLPRQKEKSRLEKIKNISFVNKAVLGQLRDKFKVIKKFRPSVICLGYDQAVDIRELKKIFPGKIIRLKPYKEYIYKSSKL